MELRHLRYFIAVADARSFHRAADTLNIAQPALSRRVQDLEAELGFALFERLAAGVRTTPEGLLFRKQAERVLEEYERAREQGRIIASGQLGELRLGAISFGPQLSIVSESVWLFKARYADVAVEIATLSAEKQLAAIRAGALDAGFVYYRPEGSEDFDFAQIQTDTFLIAMSSEHRLARQSSLRLDDLRAEPFVWMSRSASAAYFDQVMTACRERGFAPDIVQEVSTESTQLALVAAGRAICFVNSTITDRPHPKGIVARKIEDFALPIQLDLVWRRGEPSPTLQNYLDIALPLIANRGESAVRRPHPLKLIDTG